MPQRTRIAPAHGWFPGAAAAWHAHCRKFGVASGVTGPGANNSFKPTPLRSGKKLAEKACQLFTSTTRRGLTQVLGVTEQQRRMRKLSDPEFQRTLTLEQAYRLLIQFVEQYNTRGESSTLDLLGDLSPNIWNDGGSGDPAQLSDFLAVAEQVLGPSNRVA